MNKGFTNNWIMIEEVDLYIETPLGKTPLSTTHYIGKCKMDDKVMYVVVPSVGCSTFMNKRHFCKVDDIRYASEDLEDIRNLALKEIE